MTVCPLCGLPLFTQDTPPDQPTCNPLRSPDCWSMIATLPKAGSVEQRVITAARKRSE